MTIIEELVRTLGDVLLTGDRIGDAIAAMPA
ncbi:hypothetical protein ABIE78_002407 [Sinorhizobium fredii]